MDVLLNVILAVSSATLALLMSRLWSRRRNAVRRVLESLFDAPGQFRVTGTDRRDGAAWSIVTRAAGAAAARRKAEALGVDVAAVERATT